MGNDDFADFVGGVKLKEIDWLTTKIYYVIYKPGDNPKEAGKLATLLASAIREETRKRIDDIEKEYWVDSVTVHLPLVKVYNALGIEEAK